MLFALSDEAIAKFVESRLTKSVRDAKSPTDMLKYKALKTKDLRYVVAGTYAIVFQRADGFTSVYFGKSVHLRSRGNQHVVGASRKAPGLLYRLWQGATDVKIVVATQVPRSVHQLRRQWLDMVSHSFRSESPQHNHYSDLIHIVNMEALRMLTITIDEAILC